MRIDAHQHFWTYEPVEYAWIGTGMEVLARDYGPRDLEPHLTQFDMDGCVAVQASQSIDETRRLLAHAREHPFVRGVVGWADLCAGDVASQLAELARDPRLVGLRHVVQDEPDDSFLMRPDFRAGVSELSALGLTYDILIYPRQLPAAIRFAAELPDQKLVLDHVAKPLVKDGVSEPWASEIRALAQHPHVHCKVSGMVTEADWKAWKPTDFVPYLDVVLDAFGAERLMFGSDWPVCLLAAPYADMAAVVTDWAARLTDGERAQLFGENAARFYGL
ncbi:MAG: amidohydrolase family protein [bacterium]|nr:amidohydrolase family protein [bacterium]